jgi:hypothetical protein
MKSPFPEADSEGGHGHDIFGRSKIDEPRKSLQIQKRNHALVTFCEFIKIFFCLLEINLVFFFDIGGLTCFTG